MLRKETSLLCIATNQHWQIILDYTCVEIKYIANGLYNREQTFVTRIKMRNSITMTNCT